MHDSFLQFNSNYLLAFILFWWTSSGSFISFESHFVTLIFHLLFKLEVWVDDSFGGALWVKILIIRSSWTCDRLFWLFSILTVACCATGLMLMSGITCFLSGKPFFQFLKRTSSDRDESLTQTCLRRIKGLHDFVLLLSLLTITFPVAITVENIFVGPNQVYSFVISLKPTFIMFVDVFHWVQGEGAFDEGRRLCKLSVKALLTYDRASASTH